MIQTGKEIGLDAYLRRTEILDWDHPSIRDLASRLCASSADILDLARLSYEWVRDEIQHSSDHRRNPVTCRASDVLTERTGYCYAKSHLLAALLRANGLPAGLCYQRLTLDDEGPPFCLHGFNAVHLPEWGWYRVDCRGNRAGIDARFVPPREQLAYAPRLDGEVDFPHIWPDPLPCVVEALETYATWDALLDHLPDIDPVGLFGMSGPP